MNVDEYQDGVSNESIYFDGFLKLTRRPVKVNLTAFYVSLIFYKTNCLFYLFILLVPKVCY